MSRTNLEKEIRIVQLNARGWPSHYTMTISSFPRKRKGNWSIIAWTVSSKCGLIISKRIMSVNSNGNKVGHQQIAKFFESILLALQFSVTLFHEVRKSYLVRVTKNRGFERSIT